MTTQKKTITLENIKNLLYCYPLPLYILNNKTTPGKKLCISKYVYHNYKRKETKKMHWQLIFHNIENKVLM